VRAGRPHLERVNESPGGRPGGSLFCVLTVPDYPRAANADTLCYPAMEKSSFAIEHIDHEIYAANTYRGEDDGCQCRK